MKNQYSNNGITLIEFLIATAILVILGTVTVFPLLKYKQAQEFTNQTQVIVTAMRDAQQRSVTREHGAGWGVRLTNNPTVGEKDSFQIIRGPELPPGGVIANCQFPFICALCTNTYTIGSVPEPTDVIPIVPQLIKSSVELISPGPNNVQDIAFEAGSGKPIDCSGNPIETSLEINVVGADPGSSQIITAETSGKIVY